MPELIDIRPGDVIDYPFGINNEPCVATVHDVRRYDTGELSLRWSWTSNPRGVDWSGFVGHDTEWRLLSRGVAAARSTVRSLLP